jgi:hypothetical protein
MPVNMNDVLVAIRAKCLDCSGKSQKIVESCVIHDCPLYPYRSVKAIGVKKTPKVKAQVSLFDFIENKQCGGL